ncbi:hypothetical protein TSUD_320370 [Trifolium subterraneum]|uniref:RNase H type-1 domain-containing protein n=1 Tax=Trifolium subterraneum TaxID=3900 RepID=A0A2Z6MTV5_TRISU|nr:hypothetical protein TSUD_320370 [Trifolium subterraneum]
MLNNTEKECIQLITTIIYIIWLARNNKIYNQKDTPVQVALGKAIPILQDYQNNSCLINIDSNRPTTSNNRHNKSWSPPHRNFLKLNVDAHLKDDGHWGLGLVLRREDGRCVGAATKVVQGMNDATLAETRGFHEALSWVKTLHLTKVIIEMDAEVIVRAVHRKAFPRSRWGLIAKQCVRDFERNNDSQLCRQGNSAAHDLARWAFSEPNRYWNTNYPKCILHHITKKICAM